MRPQPSFLAAFSNYQELVVCLSGCDEPCFKFVKEANVLFSGESADITDAKTLVALPILPGTKSSEVDAVRHEKGWFACSVME